LEKVMGKRHDIEDLRGTIDFAIITIREDEFLAVLDRFSAPDSAENERRYEIGEMKTTGGQHYRYALVRCTKQGQNEAQSVANALIKDLDPSLLLLIGIGGAVPSDDFSLGDVVCATQVNDYCMSKVKEATAEEFNIGGGPMEVRIRNLLGSLPKIAQVIPPWNTEAEIKLPIPAVEVPEWDAQMKQYSFADRLYGGNDWEARVAESLQHRFVTNKARSPLATTQVVASSNRVIKATIPLEQWLETAYGIAAIETELAGVYAAARTAAKEYPILAIRGISDVVGFRRKDEWTKFACAVAAAFAWSLVRSGELGGILGPRGETTGRGRARRELEQRGIAFNHQSLYTHIRSANPEIVRLLLTGGLTAHIEIERETPLELCLAMIESTADSPFGLDKDRLKVLEAVLSAPEPPRDIAKKLHEALEQERLARLIALLRAGALTRLTERARFTLLQKAMAADEARGLNDRTTGPWPTLTETIIREAQTIDDDSLCLALLWSAQRGLARVADAVLSRGCSVDARLDDRLPPGPVISEQMQFFWPGGPALHFAVCSSARVVALLLEHHATPSVMNRIGNSPLHEAVTEYPSHALEVVPLLLQAGADSNAQNSVGRTPLHSLVCQYESLERAELIRLLLQKGADPEATDADGRGPLDLCLDKLEFVELLLDAGAVLTPGRCAALLHGAAQAKKGSTITWLIQRGIDVNARDERGQTALHRLTRCWGYPGDAWREDEGSEYWIERSRACLDELLRLCIDVTAADQDGETALHVIASPGDEEAMHRLIAAGAHLNARTSTGRTPLMMCRTAPAVRLLIPRGADPTASDVFGYSVYDQLTLQGHEEAAAALAEVIPDVQLGSRANLLLALRRKDRDGVCALLQSGADPHDLDEEGRPLLFTAIAADDATIVGDLLDRGVSVHTMDSYGNSAIHVAMWASSVDTLELLLDRGADLEARDARGRTPLGIALMDRLIDDSQSTIESGWYERRIHFLLDRRASLVSVDGEGNPAAFCGLRWWFSDALVRRLMEACLHERSAKGDTILHAAAYVGRHEKFGWLLDAGLDPNAQNDAGRSPLHELLGSFISDPRLATGVAALVQRGARVDIHDSFGRTALHLAVCQKSLASAEILVQHGASAQAKDNSGLTPIDEALRLKEENILQMLLSTSK
jgi:ankyrin repeat protein/nucleoside phosphorylase